MSVSSFEGSPLPVDLPTKYQKLATEYAKLRAQVGVLKKAVVDEQARSGELKDILRVKDQSLRKAEQELDSLNFRNQQLTKRVTVLQDDLDLLQNSSKKGKSKNQQVTTNPIFEEELHKKITENAQLASLLQEQSDKFENEKFTLIQQSEAYEHELKEYKKQISSFENSKMVKCENENKSLMQRLQAKDEELRQLQSQLKGLRTACRQQNKATHELTISKASMAALHGVPVQEVLSALRDFLTHIQLWYSTVCTNTDKVKLLSGHIRKNQLYLEEFTKGFNSIIVDLHTEEVSVNMVDVIAVLRKYLLSLEEVCLAVDLRSETDAVVSDISKEILTSIKTHWIQLTTALEMCLSPSISSAESEDFINKLSAVFRSLRSTCDYFSSALSDKLSKNEVHRRVQSQILASLSSVGNASGRVFKKLNENSMTLRGTIEREAVSGMEVAEPPAQVQKPVEEKPQLEQGSEYWRQEYELLKLSHSKKIKDMEDQISSLSGTTTPRSNNSSNIAQTPTEPKTLGDPVELKNMFGSLSGPWAITLETESHDHEIKKYFTSRANSYIADRQIAESKLTTLKAECGALQRRLEQSLESRQHLEAAIQQAKDTVGRLQEELTTTSSSYEQQLSSMSEHMANMNVTLASQDEQIQQLRYDLSTKDGKKGRQK